MINVQGYKGVVELPQAMQYSPRKGWHTTKKFRGPKNQIESMAVWLQNSGYRNSITMQVDPEEGAGIATLVIEYDDAQDGNNKPNPQTNEPKHDSDNWQVAGSSIEKSLWSHNQTQNLATNWSTNYAWLRREVKACQDGSHEWLTVLNTAEQSATTDGDQLAIDLFRLWMNGTEAYRYSVWELKRTRTVGVVKQGLLSMANINRILSYNDMVNYEQLPTNLQFAIDTDLVWLKDTPSVTYDNNKLQISNSFTGAESFSNLLYYNATNPYV